MVDAQFHAERLKGLYASDFHNVDSTLPYGCANRLWREKRQEKPDYEFIEVGVMKRGKKMEDLVAEEYMEETGRVLRRVNRALISTQYPFMGAHIDRQIVAIDERGLGVCELKTVGREIFYKFKNEGLTAGYIFQLQQGMLCAGRSWGSFGVLWAEPWKLIWFDVNRDNEMIDMMVRKGQVFWKMVTDGPMPERLDARDKRCQKCIYRTSCQGELLLGSVKDEGGEIPFNEDISPLMEEYIKFEEVEAEAKECKESLKDKIKEKMGDNPVMDCTGYRIHWKVQERENFQKAVLKKKYPEVYKECLGKPSIQKPWRKFAR